MCRTKFPRHAFFEELFFPIDQLVDVVRGQAKFMAVGDGIRGTRLDTIATKNAARIIDVVDLSVALASRNAIGFGILGRLNVNAIGRARGGAQKTTNAFFEPILVALQDVNAPVTPLELNRALRIDFGGRLGSLSRDTRDPLLWRT